jgi:hypothetical protein
MPNRHVSLRHDRLPVPEAFFAKQVALKEEYVYALHCVVSVRAEVTCGSCHDEIRRRIRAQ